MIRVLVTHSGSQTQQTKEKYELPSDKNTSYDCTSPQERFFMSSLDILRITYKSEFSSYRSIRAITGNLTRSGREHSTELLVFALGKEKREGATVISRIVRHTIGTRTNATKHQQYQLRTTKAAFKSSFPSVAC